MPITERLLSHSDQILSESKKGDVRRAKTLVRLIRLAEQIDSQNSEGDDPLENLRNTISGLDASRLKKYGKAISSVSELLALVPQTEVAAIPEEPEPTEPSVAASESLPEPINEVAPILQVREVTEPAVNAPEEAIQNETSHESDEAEDNTTDEDVNEGSEAADPSAIQSSEESNDREKDTLTNADVTPADDTQRSVIETEEVTSKNEGTSEEIEDELLSKQAWVYLENIIGPSNGAQLRVDQADRIADILMDIRGPLKRPASGTVNFKAILSLKFQGETNAKIAHILNVKDTAVAQALFNFKDAVTSQYSKTEAARLFWNKLNGSGESESTEAQPVVADEPIEEKTVKISTSPRPMPPTTPIVYVAPRVENAPTSSERLEIMRLAIENPAHVGHETWQKIAKEEIINLAERLAKSNDQPNPLDLAKALWDRVNFDSPNHSDQTVSDGLRAIINTIRPSAHDALRRNKFEGKPQEVALRMFVSTGGGYTTLEAIREQLSKKEKGEVTKQMTERYLVDALLEVMNV